MEKGDNENDSDVLPPLEPVSSCLPFDLITQKVPELDKRDPHPSLSLSKEVLTHQLSPTWRPKQNKWWLNRK